MKKWKVLAQSVIQYEVEIMAENEDEAIERAENLDGADWTEEETISPDWEVLRAEEVTSCN